MPRGERDHPFKLSWVLNQDAQIPLTLQSLIEPGYLQRIRSYCDVGGKENLGTTFEDSTDATESSFRPKR